MSFLPKANSHVWSAADQVMVSGCNFLIGIFYFIKFGCDFFHRGDGDFDNLFRIANDSCVIPHECLDVFS